MPTSDRQFGQHFRLSRAAIRLRRFTIADLHRATDVPENTIYSFVTRLNRSGSLETEELSSIKPGRPRKRYSLTEFGLDYLLRRNALVVSLLQGERTSGTAPIIPTTPAAVIAPATAATPDVAAWYSSAAAGGKPSQRPAVSAKHEDESDENRAAASS
jgi:hypothetical protein